MKNLLIIVSQSLMNLHRLLPISLLSSVYLQLVSLTICSNIYLVREVRLTGSQICASSFVGLGFFPQGFGFFYVLKIFDIFQSSFSLPIFNA